LCCPSVVRCLRQDSHSLPFFPFLFTLFSFSSVSPSGDRFKILKITFSTGQRTGVSSDLDKNLSVRLSNNGIKFMAFPNWTHQISESELDAQIEQAITRSEVENLTQPRAKSVHFDAQTNLIVIALKNGAFFSFPPDLVQELAEASPEALNEVWLDSSGSSVHWELLDADLDICNLISGIFGTQAWMAELGRKGGSKSSIIKAKSSRENGKKGGRPRKNMTVTPNLIFFHETHLFPFRRRWLDFLKNSTGIEQKIPGTFTPGSIKKPTLGISTEGSE
jgi:hypothetical protein